MCLKYKNYYYYYFIFYFSKGIGLLLFLSVYFLPTPVLQAYSLMQFSIIISQAIRLSCYSFFISASINSPRSLRMSPTSSLTLLMLYKLPLRAKRQEVVVISLTSSMASRSPPPSSFCLSLCHPRRPLQLCILAPTPFPCHQSHGDGLHYCRRVAVARVAISTSQLCFINQFRQFNVEGNTRNLSAVSGCIPKVPKSKRINSIP